METEAGPWLSLPCTILKKASCLPDSYLLRAAPSGLQLEVGSLADRPAALAAAQIGLAASLPAPFFGQQQASMPVRALILQGDYPVTVASSWRVWLPSELFSREEPHQIDEERASSLFCQLLSCGYRQLALGKPLPASSTSSYLASLSADEPIERLATLASGCGVELLLAPQLTEESWSLPATQAEWLSSMELLLGSLSCLKQKWGVGLLWSCLWLSEVRRKAVALWEVTSLELLLSELELVHQQQIAPFWYQLPPFSEIEFQAIASLPKRIDPSIVVLFGATASATGTPLEPLHPLWNQLLAEATPASSSLVTLLDLSQPICGAGLWPLHWPYLFSKHLERARLLGIRGVALQIASLPQPQSWLWGSLWSIAQFMWGRNIPLDQLPSLWMKTFHGSSWSSDEERSAQRWSSLVVEVASRLQTKGMASLSLLRQRLELLLAELDQLQLELQQASSCWGRWSLACWPDLRRLFCALIEREQLALPLQVRGEDLRPGFFSRMDGQPGQSIRKGLRIELWERAIRPQEGIDRELDFLWDTSRSFWQSPRLHRVLSDAS